MKTIVAFAASLVCLATVTAQVVNPGGGVSSMSDVPGLTNALGNTLTNAVKGSDTGASTGAVEKTGQQAVIHFPTIPAYLLVTTNFVHGTTYIDVSGTTTVSFAHTFSNIPFMTITPVGTNIGELLTPVILSVTNSSATFKVLSSGAIVTNTSYRLDWQANDGAGLTWSGTSIEMLGGPTNIYRCDGSNGMSVFYFPTGAGLGKWLASDGTGHGSWENKTIANLTDGAEVFKRGGTVPATANWNMGGFTISNLWGIQINTGAGLGRVLTSDALGIGSWQTISPAGWSAYAANCPVNMAGYAVSGVGALTVAGIGTFNGTAHFNAGAEFNTVATYFNSSINANAVTTIGTVNLNKTGGSSGSPAFYVAGYARFDGAADLKSSLNVSGVTYANRGILCYPGPASYDPYIGLLTAPDGTHIASEGNIYAGADAYLRVIIPMSPGYGNIVAQYGIYGSSLTISGSKTFRIQHPKDTSKYLYHASIESPNIELLYRGSVQLSNGKATVNLNDRYGLTPNTLDNMLANLTVNVYNNKSWTRVRCSKIKSNVEFEIEAETADCNDIVEWVAIATRVDDAVKDYKVEASK